MESKILLLRHGITEGNKNKWFYGKTDLPLLPEGIEAQTEQSLKNLGAVLKEAGYDYTDVVKTLIFLADIGDFAKVNEIYSRYFDAAKPARSCVEVANIPKGALVEIECIAVK